MKCKYCNGNDKDMLQCAYPSENKPGCLRYSRIKSEISAKVKNNIPEKIRNADDFLDNKYVQ